MANNIAVIGFGPIGQALTGAWSRAGHPVVVGTRDPARTAGQAADCGAVRCLHWTDAVQSADVVVLAIPYPAVDAVVSAWQSEWVGKIVIDPSNPVELSADGRIISGLTVPGTVGSHLARRLPSARLVRAFTHVMDELLASRGRRQPGLWAIALAGDDGAAKEHVATLVQDTGFVPVDIGSLAESAPLDPGGVLFPHLFTAAEIRLALAGDG